MSHKKDLHLLSGLRALITEDEAIIAMDLEYTLREVGCEIAGVANSLESAEKVLLSGRVDFAVLDVNLGGKNVFSFARKLRAQGIPFFFLTGYSYGNIIPDEFRRCVCLEKPVRDVILLHTAVGLFAKPPHQSSKEAAY